jgi:hypothetical protein
VPARHRRIEPARHRRRYLLAVAVIVAAVLGASGLAVAHVGSGRTATATATLTSTSADVADRTDRRVSRDLARSDPSSPSPTASSTSPSPSTASPTPPAPRPSPTQPAAKPSTPAAVPAGCGQYSGNQLIACQLLPSFGFATSQMSSLVPMWNRESGWNTTAQNPSSGAYGIPQALPGDKMATVASDWRTNPATQIKWGLGYIKDRYGTPSAAWAFWQNNGWY